MPKILDRAAVATLLIGFLVTAAACGARAAREAPTRDLLTSLQATTAGDSVHFLLQVTNPGPEPVTLEFAADPIVQFVVRRDAMLLWDSAPESVAADRVTADTLRAGETRSFDASWSVPMGLRGALTVSAALRDRRAPLVQSTRFVVQ